MISKTDIKAAPQGGRYQDAAARIDLYVLLSHLLLNPPAEDLIGRLANLNWNSEMPRALSAALQTLRTAAVSCSPRAVNREFEDLFIGMGRGEIVPYASWYAEKLLMSTPLARLRGDLAKLQIGRQAKVCEPEDHAAALCETMALMIRRSEISPARQSAFFNRHVNPWMIRFFRDLQQAPSARFYRAVGCLGEEFLRAEKLHLQLK